MGDGIMALFGASIAHEDRAVRACYAALRTRAKREERASAAPSRQVIVRQSLDGRASARALTETG